MEKTQKITERLPEFYRAWDPESVMYKLVDGVGRALTEQQKEVFRILKHHWVDTAFKEDLDRLGSLFDIVRTESETDEDYRVRIKSAVRQFKGGGTRDAILTFVGAYLGLEDINQLDLVENPPTKFAVKKKVTTGDSWAVGSMSVEDAQAKMKVTIEGEGGRVLNPTLKNYSTGEMIRLEGTMNVGQELTIANGAAVMDGENVTESLS